MFFLGFLLILILAGIGFMLWKIQRTASTARPNPEAVFMNEALAKMQKEMAEFRHSFQDQVLGLNRQITDQYSQNTRFLIDSHKGYSDSVEKVQNRLGELQHATQTMVGIGKDIASLQDILRSPKLRGGLGEFLLEQLLAQILPEENFTLQYAFRDGSKVDAVIRMGDGLIPVDAKFPLENFRRYLEEKDEEKQQQSRKQFMSDVRKRVDEIASKYILPQEGTYDFALMYIPAENVYYEILIKGDSQKESLSEYAQKRHVIPVSPNSLYAYLGVIAKGLRGLKIERSASVILESLQQLENDFRKVMDDFEKIGGHFTNAQSAYERSLKGMVKLQTRLNTLGEEGEKKLIASEVSA